MNDRPIVVGFDGSASAETAMTWAIEEASRCGATVDVLLAHEWPPTSMLCILVDSADAAARDHARRLVDGAIDRARRIYPRVEVSGRVESGRPTSVLCAASRTARMVVVGSRGRGGLTEMLAGSVSVAVATHAASPVVVVRREPTGSSLPVVVGVDDRASSRDAVDFAFREAAMREVEVVAVRAWRPPIPATAVEAERGELIAEIETAERIMLDETVAEATTRYPEVAVRTRLIVGGAAEVLIDASRKAQLLVVGARGRGGFSGLLLGSVGHQVLHHAACPVAIARG